MEILKLSELIPHPKNRPLGINQEKVDQIAEMMKISGYDHSKPIKARPYKGSYQIIEGEHRWRAAEKAGLLEVPVFIVELDDDEALIQLVAGNVQTDSHTLDYGYAALAVCKKDSKKGLSIAAFADRLGKSADSIKRAIKGAEVRIHIEQSRAGARLLDKTESLNEISKCNREDWGWFHELALTKELTKNDVIEISKRIREIDKIAGESSDEIFDLVFLKKELAQAKDRIYESKITIIEALESCYNNIKESYDLYKYDFEIKEVIKYKYLANEDFIKELKALKDPTKSDIFKVYNNILKTIRQGNKEDAEKTKLYYQDEKNRIEAEERERAEWEAFMPELGKWYELGKHKVYCGDNTDKSFIEGLPNAKFAFSDPPYNENVDKWDSNFVWNQDYIEDKADIVCVTPGISQIASFFKTTKMDYKWSISAWISNGMTRGALGFGNWIYLSIFSKLESIHRNAQDFYKISIKTSENKDHFHKGKKPNELIEKLLKEFTNEGDFVIDNFLGSGTTLFQCEESNRICYGAEKDTKSCKLIMSKFKKEYENGI